tara:strand:+ start:222 stop:476 length:255 start_codon:yes stop_codon:yes gene_type:complete
VWQEAKDYFQFQVGDIVSEDISIIYWDDDPMTGIVLDTQKHVYFLGDPDYEIYQDQLTIYWFKSGRIEHIPSDFINLVSRRMKE